MCKSQKSEASPAEAAADDKRARFDALPFLEVSSAAVRLIPRGKGFVQGVIDWLKPRNVLGSHINYDTGWDNIILNRASVRNVTYHGGKDGKVALLALAPKLINYGIYLETTPKNDQGLISHIFAGKAKIDGVRYAIVYVVREDVNGRRYYEHSLTKMEALGRIDDQALVSTGKPQKRIPAHTFRSEGEPVGTENPRLVRIYHAGESAVDENSTINILKKHLKVNRSAENIQKS